MTSAYTSFSVSSRKMKHRDTARRSRNRIEGGHPLPPGEDAAKRQVRAGMAKRFGWAALTLALRAVPLPEGEGLCRPKILSKKQETRQ